MRKFIEKEVIEEIRKNSDIVDVISQYIPVEKKGKNYVSVCPFHDDHSPSMHIHKDKQIYRCFACGASGNVFGFVSDFEKISFYEAVAKLGIPLGIKIDVDHQPVKVDETKKPYYDIIQEAILYGQFQVLVNDIAKDYLAIRNINKDQIDKFEIGYDDGKMSYYLNEKGYSYELMQEAYLVFDSIDYVDVFKERLLFPIHDLQGNPVGFTGRTLTNANAKYINTSETKVYRKGDLLYNYHRVKPEINKFNHVYLVEGTMDVIAFDKAGITNCIASLGTAITPEQIKALKRLNTTIYSCFDGDSAGRNATYKFGLIASETGLKFEIVDWDSDLDPDDFLTKQGTSQFNATINKTKPWIHFLFEFLKSKYNLDNYSDKKNYAKEIADEIFKLSDVIEQKAYFEVLKNTTGFDYSNAKPVKVVEKNFKVFTKLRSSIDKAQLELLNQIILSKRACDIYIQTLNGLPNKLYNDVALKIIDFYYQQTQIEISELFNELKPEESKIIAEILDDELFLKEYNESAVVDNIRFIQIAMLEEAKANLKNKINSEVDRESKNLLMKQALEITAKIDDLIRGKK